MKPAALVLRAAGVNCDAETVHAFDLAGARGQLLHINRLLENPAELHRFQILAIPGGFSYGDDIAAGRILANQITHHLRDELARFIEAGKPIIGICNGFQVLTKTDLLPGPLNGRGGQLCTLTNNDGGRFVDRWIHLAPVSRKCIWTKEGLGFGVQGSERASDLNPEPQTPSPTFELPIAHGEGKFVPFDDEVRQALHDSDQVALVYANNDNPNGSIDNIAGVCDATGLVFGLMPHPERHIDPMQHYAWTSRKPLPKEGPGLQFFRNAVNHVMAAVGAGV